MDNHSYKTTIGKKQKTADNKLSGVNITIKQRLYYKWLIKQSYKRILVIIIVAQNGVLKPY